MFEAGLVYAFSAILLLAALRVITARNPVHSAMFLVLSFFTAAGIWLLLRAEFLAIALVLVYVGAVMVLFLFVVMMLDINLVRLREGFWRWFPFGVALALVPPLLLALVQPEYKTVFPFLVIALVVVSVHFVAINVLTPKLVGGRVKLNALSVTIAMMFWGWLWGGIGLILAVPITAAFKAVCDNVQSLKPYGAWMGESIGLPEPLNPLAPRDPPTPP